ncbi:hypothetical protein BDV59DRAFT_199376 [Aspergillus ambiguus]|uniref:uncharacterized protein n=1 Tax=Aspergillus ambiguus TaxID=176160 RepID=UPI003CCE20B8
MRFFSIIATALLAATPAVMAEQNAQNCLAKCHVHSTGVNCPAAHPNLVRESVGCFKCCK